MWGAVVFVTIALLVFLLSLDCLILNDLNQEVESLETANQNEHFLSMGSPNGLHPLIARIHRDRCV